MRKISQGLRKLGPYVAVELLMPSGTVVALLLWVAQQKRKTT